LFFNWEFFHEAFGFWLRGGFGSAHGRASPRWIHYTRPHRVPTTRQHSFLYNGSGYITLDPTGSGSTVALGVSGNNVAGTYLDSGNITHGFLYNGSGYATLDPIGSKETQANAVSGNNVAGSFVDTGGKFHGFLYNGLGYTVLDVPGSLGTIAQAISGDNVAGYYGGGSGGMHGFLYQPGVTTPEPTSLTLLGIGIAGMAGYGWRRRKAKVA
jgi:hypothetical protein